MVVTTTFATWFGAETVMGIPAKFVEGGLNAVIEDPFGASMCLVLVGLFFARKLYLRNIITIGDYYRQRYGRVVEVLCSLIIIFSYLGWVGAQITALGLVFNLLSQGAVSLTMGMVIGTLVVLVYTLDGGMWSVALTDFVQMIVIAIGLLAIAWYAGNMAGGADKVVAVKLLHEHLAADEAVVSMFLDEARIVSAINHVNVSTVFDFGEQDGAYYLVMEYLEGEALDRVLKAHLAGTQRHPLHPWLMARVLADADHVEERRHQAVHLAELHLAALGLAGRDPVEQRARCREIDADQPRAGDDHDVGTQQAVFQGVQRLGGVTQDLAGQFHHGHVGHLRVQGRHLRIAIRRPEAGWHGIAEGLSDDGVTRHVAAVGLQRLVFATRAVPGRR